MDAMPQVPLGQSNLFLNPDQRCPVVVLKDRSYSMLGARITQLNAGFQSFVTDVSADAIALRRVDIAVVTYGPVQIAQPFTTADRLSMPALTADADTPMGEAIMTAIKLLDDRKKDYRQAGVPYFRPWIFNITDGAPTDDIRPAEAAIRQGEANKSFSMFNVGVENADMGQLARLSSRPPLHLNGLAFRQMFLWLSHSLRSVSRSTPGVNVPLVNPIGPGGWATVSTT
jgi:uncharacterized protein YegL